ncbi:MAG: EAL domain-containing protein [Proteobacteria bacterium]|nr:EAL domain-containing protein [Pseudomonadota bacterium]
MNMRISFRTKLLLLTIVPLAVAQVVTLFAVMQTIELDIESRARESLNIGANVVNEFLAARGKQLRRSVAVLAADYGLKEAHATGDAITIRSVLENHRNRVGADIAALLDLDGAPIASTLDFESGRLVELEQLADESAPAHRESTALISGTLYHVFTVPLRAPVTVGWIVMAFRIDDELSNRISALTGLAASIVRADSGPAAITSTTATSSDSIDLNIASNVVYMTHDAVDESLTIQTSFIRGDEAVLVVLQRSMREAMQPYIEARRGLIAFGAALLLFVAIAGAWFSTTISRPLRTLHAAARRMISGNYDTSLTVNSSDEFGELASSFNAMQTAIAEREQRISHYATHDSLTDLPNQTSVLTGLTATIESARNDGTPVAVLSIRLTRMGEISSTLGHSATDDLIKLAARQLLANFDGGELLGQTGTNEFVLVVPGHDSESALAYVDRIEHILGSGVTLGRVNIILQTAIGIADFPRHSQTAAELLRHASIARTESSASKDRFRIYQEGREDEFQRRLRIVNDLPSALRKGEIQVWFQPKVSLPDGAVCGAEALVRWQHPEFGFLLPDDFIATAEQSGTIVHLTRYVIADAVRQCRAWEDAGHTLQVSLNLSARDLADEYLPYHVLQILKEQNLPAARLTLEVTENSIMDNIRHAVTILECLRDIGVQISMDDFGTGHSSLAQLRNIPLHELKIDKSFVMSLVDDEHNDAIVRTTVDLAHNLNLSVVAEGVECEETMRRIAAMGCEQVQGYFLSEPLRPEKFLAWVNDFEPVAYDDRRDSRRAFANS